MGAQQYELQVRSPLAFASVREGDKIAMQRDVVNVGDTPEPSDLPFSSAIRARGDFVFTSGHVGFDPATGEPPEGITAQTEQALQNLKAVLEAAGTSLEGAVKVNVYISSPEHYEPMNDVYRRFFPTDRPARTTVVTELVRADLLVEIEIVALMPNEEGS